MGDGRASMSGDRESKSKGTHVYAGSGSSNWHEPTDAPSDILGHSVRSF